MPGSATIGYASSPNIIPTTTRDGAWHCAATDFRGAKKTCAHHDVELVVIVNKAATSTTLQYALPQIDTYCDEKSPFFSIVLPLLCKFEGGSSRKRKFEGDSFVIWLL